tara:strand:+ start:438 stop:1670 length:1233 start_codon:yes stop_codon:yes gene_type:complete
MSTLTNYENPGLIKQTNSEYYAGKVTVVGSGASPQVINWPTNLTPLIWTDLLTAATQKSVNNYDVYIDNVLQAPGVGSYISDQVTTTLSNSSDPATSAQTVTVTYTGGVPNTSLISIQLKQESIWDNYKNYQYSTLSDIVSNFMISYVGTDRIIRRARRSEIIFHAKRGLQEFSYDTLRSVNTQELTIPANLSLPLPQDYVNYVQLSYIDGLGVKHIIYPTTLTSNPTAPLIQDDQGVPTQDQYGNNIESQQSITNERWRNANQRNLNGTNFENDDANVYNWQWWKTAFGQRYGLDPAITQTNGWFTIDERRGAFAFSGNLQGRLITLEYISDGLGYSEDSRVPKMAEEALYMYIMYNIISTRSNIPEYIINRYRKEKSAKLRNAKIRLSNIKLSEFTQVMRGKSKWIKS